MKIEILSGKPTTPDSKMAFFSYWGFSIAMLVYKNGKSLWAPLPLIHHRKFSTNFPISPESSQLLTLKVQFSNKTWAYWEDPSKGFLILLPTGQSLVFGIPEPYSISNLVAHLVGDCFPISKKIC